MYLLIKHAKVRPDFINTMLKPLISAVICAATAFGVYMLCNHFLGGIRGGFLISLVAAIIIAVIVYIVALMLIKTFRKEELLMLPKGNNIVTILAKLHLLR